MIPQSTPKPTGPIVLSEDGTRKFKGTVTRIIDAFFIVDDDCYCSRTLLPPVRRRAELGWADLCPLQLCTSPA